MTDHYAILEGNTRETWILTLYRQAYAGATVYLPAGRTTVPGDTLLLDADSWLWERGFRVTAWKDRAGMGYLAELRETES